MDSITIFLIGLAIGGILGIGLGALLERTAQYEREDRMLKHNTKGSDKDVR